MPKLNYFRKDITEKSHSLEMFSLLVLSHSINQPVIFCDNYSIDYIKNVPILHSYYINNHFQSLSWILTDYDQIKYIQDFYHQNYIIVYDPNIHSIGEYKDTSYKFISINDDILQYVKENINDQI